MTSRSCPCRNDHRADGEGAHRLDRLRTQARPSRRRLAVWCQQASDQTQLSGRREWNSRHRLGKLALCHRATPASWQVWGGLLPRLSRANARPAVLRRHRLRPHPEGNLHIVIRPRPFDAVIRELSIAIDAASQARFDAAQTRREAEEIVRDSRSLRESLSLRRRQLRLRRAQRRPSGDRAA